MKMFSITQKLNKIYAFNDIESNPFSLKNMTKEKLAKKIQKYYGVIFLIFWLVLFFAVVIPIYQHLPNSFDLKDEPQRPGEFIAEYAQKILYKFDRIGPKVTGSYANENKTVQLLLDEIKKIQNLKNNTLYDMEIDLQQVSGAYIYGQMINMYQGVQNIIVKLSTKNSRSNAYLLVNSHFDSKPGTPATGDDGFMVVIMLETLRQIATSEQTFQHPIIFLFNGAEENSLEGSHGFITQHKWAKNCKAFINLDATGSGGKEILFQSGPKHNWLMELYKNNVKHPFATTLAEEVFQSGFIPSDTDFRIFRDYGHLPGLDFAQFKNGYVYHTKFDSFNIISRRSIQSTGDNVLANVRALANANQLLDIEKHTGGHAVFFDFLGLFFVYYTEVNAVIINCLISFASLTLICISLWRISIDRKLSFYETIKYFSLICGIQIIGFILAFGIPVLLACLLDVGNHSMTWFTNTWLCIGLYVCPALLGLSLPLFILITKWNPEAKINQLYCLQMGLHSHGAILALLCIILSSIGLRSAYILMLPILFYTISLYLNQIYNLPNQKNYWAMLHTSLQVIPFIYSSYLIHTLLVAIIPMTGRNGSAFNPDIFIATLCSLGAILALGFLIPVTNIFQRPKRIIALLAVISMSFLIMSLTPLGFPFRPRTNVERINFLQVQRIFYDYNGTVFLNDSGYLFDFQDRRRELTLINTEKLNISGIRRTTIDCQKYMMCGMPLYNHRWVKAKSKGAWLPRDTPIVMPDRPVAELELLKKVIDTNSSTTRYDFKLSGPSHMSLFLQPLPNVTLTNWSFLAVALEPKMLSPPYHIYFVSGNDRTPLNFYFNFKSEFETDEPLFELGVSAHYISFEYERDKRSAEFIKHFPDYVHALEWPSIYKRYIF